MKSEVLHNDCYEMVLLFPQKTQQKYGAGTGAGDGHLRTRHCQADCFRLDCGRCHHRRGLSSAAGADRAADSHYDTKRRAALLVAGHL